MATSSITKEFVIKEEGALERLEKILEKEPVRRQAEESPLLKRGKEKLSTFVFR